MRSRVAILVAVVSTAIVASFVVPLLLLVSTLAESRAMAAASQQANSVAALVSSLHDDPRLASVLPASLTGSTVGTTVVLADGTVLGAAWPDHDLDAAYLRARGGQAFSTRDSSGGHVYVPVIVEHGVAIIRTSVTSAQLADGVPAAWAAIIGLGVVLSAAAVLVAAAAGRRISVPLLAVADTAHRLRAGDLTARATLDGTPEIVEVGSALNGLAERIDELLAAERESVRGLAHRLRTPVTALRLEAERVADPQARDELADLIGQLQVAIDAVVREARQPLREDLPVGCDAAAVIAARAAYWRPLAEDQERSMEVRQPDGPVWVVISALDLADSIDICIDNVFAHTDEGVGFTIELTSDRSSARLRITDAGRGYPARTAGSRPGTSGFGLQLVRRTIQRARGSVAMSPPGQPGATIDITLPLGRASAPDQGAAPSAPG